ncbi:MAG TPA: hypothetical protein VGO86_01070 [Candidatus Dormibacteraeota bacterium]|jgi:hypothetical protein
MQPTTQTQSRFADSWTETLAAETADLERRSVERGYRRMLALTDRVLGQLEQRNLAGQRRLDRVVQQHIEQTLRELPPRAQSRFPDAARTVQEALDGIFDVQAELLLVLQRMLHWDRLLVPPWDEPEDDYVDAPPSRRTA